MTLSLPPARLLRSILLTAAFASGAAAAAGFPDPAFGVGGVYLSPLSGNHGPTDGLIDAQGRYVIVGSRVGVADNGSFIFRIGAGGQPDVTFNGSGNVQLVAPLGYEALVLSSVRQQADGKLVVAGRVGPNFINAESAVPYLCRLLDNGSVDPAFGNGGCIVQPYVAAATEEFVTDMALQDDGHIVVAGVSMVAGTRRTAVLRLNQDGSRDLCFTDPTCTSGGSLYDPMPGNSIISIGAVDVGPDGRIVLAGFGNGPQNVDMIAVRLLPNGAIDGGFGNAGSRTVPFDLGGANNDGANSVVVLPDGAILLAGSAADSASGFRAAVAKLSPQGQLDLGFGQGGTGRSWTFYTDVSLNSVGTDVAVQDDGKIVVGGTSYLGLASTQGHFAAWRLLANGVTDMTFGFDGRITVTTSDDPENQQVTRAIDTQGEQVVLFGFRRATNQSNPKAAIVRLDVNGVFRDGFDN